MFRLICFTLSLFIISTSLVGQTNGGFESGFDHWKIAGDISIDSANARNGKSCAQIGNHGSIIQRMHVSPFSILQFDIYVKCSIKKIKAFSFIRFYDSAGNELLEYKSDGIDAATYQQTGNYTEAPPNTNYIDIGVERDSIEEGYIYVDDFSAELNVGKPAIQHKPICNLDQYMLPFWKTDTIYNETVLLYSINGNPATGKLLFQPEKILSVKSFDLNIIYKKNIDFIVKENNIIRTANSKMPFRADTSFDTKNDFAWYNLQSQWIVVTYIHTDKWKGPVPSYKANKLPRLLAKLKSKLPVKIIAYGMSIARGLDVSSYDTVPPYMPTYVDLFVRQLKKIYSYQNIHLYNAGLPGSLVSWGAAYADKYINPIKPDFVILDFGMNDFWRYTPTEFKTYIETIIHKIQKDNPDVSFLLLSNMKFDPDYILDSDKNKHFYVTNMEGYNTVLKELETTGIINLDMTTLSDAIYKQKKAKDCIANPLHPNDYLARWYAQGLSALFENVSSK